MPTAMSGLLEASTKNPAIHTERRYVELIRCLLSYAPNTLMHMLNTIVTVITHSKLTIQMLAFL